MGVNGGSNGTSIAIVGLMLLVVPECHKAECNVCCLGAHNHYHRVDLHNELALLL